MALTDVPPRLVVNKTKDITHMHAILKSHGFLCLSTGIAGADCSNIVWCQLRGIYSAAANLSFLLHHVSHIVVGGAKEQVSRIDAPRVIAMMADKQVAGYRAIGKLISHAMGLEHFAAAGTFFDGTVASLKDRTSPGDATIRHWITKTIPKPLCKRHAVRQSVAFAGTVNPLIWAFRGHQGRLANPKRLAALLTDAVDHSRMSFRHGLAPFQRTVIREAVGYCRRLLALYRTPRVGSSVYAVRTPVMEPIDWLTTGLAA